VKWFRKHVKLGSRLALFAFAIQFALSFGHFHPTTAQAAPAIQTGLTKADLATAVGPAAPDVSSATAHKERPSNPDGDQHPADACAICAVISLVHNVLFSTPPVLLLPQAVELLYLTTDAEFVHLNSAHLAFQSRAPPRS
jgi:hypothetical protein